MKVTDLNMLKILHARLKTGIVKDVDVAVLGAIIDDYEKRRQKINKISKATMRKGRAVDKNYGSHYTYKDRAQKIIVFRARQAWRVQ